MRKPANIFCKKLIKKVEADSIYIHPQVSEADLLAMLPKDPLPARNVDVGIRTKFELHYGHLLCAGIHAIVANGDSSGWKMLRRHAHFTYLEARQQRLVVEQGAGANGIFPWYAASAVAQCMLFGDAEPAGWLADQLSKPGNGGVASAGRVTPFEAFIVVLNAVWKQGAKPSEHANRKDLGPYAEALAEWDRPDKLADVFVRLADHHVAMSKSRAQFPVSFEGHEACWPFEFQAIWRVRNDAGLEMPTFEHELIRNNPMFVPPPDLGPFSDPLHDTMEKALLGPA